MNHVFRQTETGGILITLLPGCIPVGADSATMLFFVTEFCFSGIRNFPRLHKPGKRGKS